MRSVVRVHLSPVPKRENACVFPERSKQRRDEKNACIFFERSSNEALTRENACIFPERSSNEALVRNEPASSEQKRSMLRRGGVAQLGEHLPCKQGVMSSNLTVSILAKSEYAP